jgi:hypothetical protein
MKHTHLVMLQQQAVPVVQTVGVVLVAIERRQLVVPVVPLERRQQTSEVLVTQVDLLDLILRTVVCKVLMHKEMQLQRAVLVHKVLRGRMEERQQERLLEVRELPAELEQLVVLLLLVG